MTSFEDSSSGSNRVDADHRSIGKATVSILDYGAGNVRSIRNAIKLLDFPIKDIATSDDILSAEVIIFPGQGNFRQAMQSLRDKGWVEALRQYVRSNRPFFGICLGMQLLFEGSEESPGVEGLGLIPGMITKFDSSTASVPQIGWNGLTVLKECPVVSDTKSNDMVYFVHSFCAKAIAENLEWILSITDYGDQRYISMVSKGNVVAAQFHPEKSGRVGLNMIRQFLERSGRMVDGEGVSDRLHSKLSSVDDLSRYRDTVRAKRVIACLDVRSNDSGDLVVTKGDQYDVREKATGGGGDSMHGRGGVRNLGKPVALCKRYYEEGADEVVFLNITSFRQGVIGDLPMLQVLESSSENVFVPLTVGGGIREYTDPSGKYWSSLEVAAQYFRAGADKISIGSDAVFAAESFLASGVLTGLSSIEQISNHYGAQAVVVSIDPKRVYLKDPMVEEPSADSRVSIVEECEDEHPLLGMLRGTGRTVVHLPPDRWGPDGEEYCWWPVTVKGGRELRSIDAILLAKVCEALGAGEIMLNCINMDGQCRGYDIPLVNAVQNSVSIPVIASSGAGQPEHFSQVFRETSVQAALAAGMFHREEVSIGQVKEHLLQEGITARMAL